MNVALEFQKYKTSTELQISSLESEKQKLTMRLAITDAANAEIKSEMEILGASLDQARQENIETRQELAAFRARVTEFGAERMNTEKKNAELETLIKENMKLKQAQDELSLALDSMNDELTRAKSASELSLNEDTAQKDQHDTVRRQMESEIVRLNRKVAQLSSANQQIEKQLFEQNAAIDAMKLGRYIILCGKY